MLVSIGELKAAILQAKGEAEQCADFLADAEGHAAVASTHYAAVLMGAYDAVVEGCWGAMSRGQETLAETRGLLSEVMVAAEAYVADIDGPSGGFGSGRSAPAPSGLSVPVAGGRAKGTAIRRVRRFAATGFGNRTTALIHLGDHGRDFGARTVEEYVASAAEFLRRAQREGLPARVSKNGRVRVFDPIARAFASFDVDGTIVTYYKPGRGYWERNEGKWGDEVFWE